MTATYLALEDLALDASRLEAELSLARELISVALCELHAARLREFALTERYEGLRDEMRRYVAARVSPL